MHRVFSWMLALTLLTGLAGASLSAFGRVTTHTSALTPTIAEDVALLPASDLIAVVNVNRFFSELLPKIKTDAPTEVAKMAKDLDTFTDQTGIDVSKIKTAIIGVKLDGAGGGAIILQGMSFDAKRIESTVKTKQGEFKATDYKGRSIYSVKMKAAEQAAATAAAAGLPINLSDDVNFAALDGQTAVAGDLSAIKSVLDAQASGKSTNPNAALSTALNESKASGLVRFAASLPNSLRQDLSSQGDLFTQLAAVKMVVGSFDMGNDLSLALDTLLRTGSQNEASQLETGLKSLVFLGKTFLSGNQEPQMQVFTQLLDQIKISTQTADVALSIALPRALLDQFGKQEKKTEPIGK